MVLRALAIAAAIVAAAAAAVYSGVYNVAADEPHWPLTERLLDTVRTRSIEARARGLALPTDFDGEKQVLVGAGQYAEMCEGCHLAPGVESTPLRQGLYPKPPDFTRRAHGMDARAEFCVIKHGIKMSAMPAWGASHDDEKIWSLVAFVRKLPELDARRYREMVKKAPADKVENEKQKPSAREGGHAGMEKK